MLAVCSFSRRINLPPQISRFLNYLQNLRLRYFMISLNRRNTEYITRNCVTSYIILRCYRRILINYRYALLISRPNKKHKRSIANESEVAVDNYGYQSRIRTAKIKRQEVQVRSYRAVRRKLRPSRSIYTFSKPLVVRGGKQRSLPKHDRYKISQPADGLQYSNSVTVALSNPIWWGTSE